MNREPQSVPREEPQLRPEVVLVIHGTAAATPFDSTSEAEAAGHPGQWWHAGSRFCSEIETACPQVRAHRAGEVFHWSGANSERQRRAAGRQLAERLLQLEAEGRPFHLIAHSHGGSVVWHALCVLRTPLSGTAAVDVHVCPT